MPELAIKYDAPPTLAEFLDSNAFVRCCIGPVGSGKSSVCVMEILRRACEQQPGPSGKRYTRFAVIRNCYDAQTEILTEHRGWVRFPDLLLDERVASLHGNTVEWEVPSRHYAAPYSGEMVGVRSQSVDLLVTPEHHLWVSPRQTRQKIWGEYRHMRADEIESIGGLSRMRGTATFPDPEDERTEAFMEFLGFWFAEGYAGIYPRKDCDGSHYRLVVTQKPREYVDELLTAAGFQYSMSLKDGGANYTISTKSDAVKDLIAELVQYGSALTKWIPRKIIEAPRRLLEAFLYGFHQGDGSGGVKNPQRPQILHTGSSRMANDLHEMATRAGYFATVCDAGGGMWAVTLHSPSRSSPVIQKEHWRRERYDGVVYCVEVSTHVVLVRRNGKPIWCGQTYRELRDTTRKTFEQWIPAALGTWHEQDFSFTMRFNDVDCEVLFRSLDRPEDIKKLLSLELTGAYINEAREVPKQVLDMLSSRVGRYPSPAQGGASWFGIWMDTNPWHAGHWGSRYFEQTPPDHARAFRQPSGRAANAENVQHLPAGYYDRLCIGKDSEWISVYVDGHDAQAAQGSVYGVLVSMLKQRGGISDFDHGPDEVFTAWDLGIADMLDIWWFCFNGEIGRDGRRGVDVIDWYEAHNQPLSHYIEVIRSKPYKYARHFLPHDARARSLQTGISTIEQVQKELDHVAIVPQLDVDQGIEAARWLLEQPTTRFHSRCDLIPQNAEYSGLGLLAEYRYEWDEVRKVFSRTPLHNFASHAADGFRYVACAVRQSDMLTAPPVIEPERPIVKDLRTISIRAYLGDKWDPTRPTATRQD